MKQTRKIVTDLDITKIINDEKEYIEILARLIILDLDNTLIYSDYSARLKVNQLFKYMDFLYVYERPYAREFIQRCHEVGEVMIFTMAEWEYADQVSVHLDIRPARIFSRDDCFIQYGVIRKRVPDLFYEIYDQIIIIDDNPEIWEVQDHEKCRVFVPTRFTGNKKDQELKMIMEKQLNFTLCNS